MRNILCSIIIISLFFLIACKDKKDQAADLPPQLNKLFESIKESSQSFTITAGQYATIKGKYGTVITFSPSSFLDNNQNFVTEGQVKIELLETLNGAQMIKNRVFTTTQNHRLLVSGGAIYIKATLRDVELKTNNYSIAYYQPTNSNLPMALYYGITHPLPGGSSVIWQEDTSGTTLMTVKQDTNGNNSYYYNFDSVTQFNWVSSAMYMDFNGAKSNIKVVMPNNIYTNENTEVILYIKDINLVVSVNTFEASSNTFMHANPNYYLPIGLQADVLVLHEKNNVYQMYLQKDVIISENMSINADMQNTSIAEISAAIDSL